MKFIIIKLCCFDFNNLDDVYYCDSNYIDFIRGIENYEKSYFYIYEINNLNKKLDLFLEIDGSCFCETN